MINSYNLLDNMDGLSSGTAVIALLSFMAIDSLYLGALLSENAPILLGAVLGFLLFNLPPAKIFMGDNGALPLGYLLAVISIQGTWHQASSFLS